VNVASVARWIVKSVKFEPVHAHFSVTLSVVLLSFTADTVTLVGAAGAGSTGTETGERNVSRRASCVHRLHLVR